MKESKLLTQREERKMQKRKLREGGGSRRYAEFLYCVFPYVVYIFTIFNNQFKDESFFLDLMYYFLIIL